MSVSVSALVSSPRRRGLEQPRWRRLARVTLLEHWGALAVLALIGVALVVAIVIEDRLASGSFANYLHAGCVAHPATIVCDEDASYLSVQPLEGLAIALRLLPLLVGVFLGAPLVARELESGTFRFAWTQGIRRTRLVATELAVLGVALGALAVVLGALFGSWYAHLFHVALDPVQSPWQATFFFTTWWLLGAWTAFSLALGTLIGALVKRTVAAMALGGALLAGLIVAAFSYLPSMLAIGATISSRVPKRGLLLGTINGPAQIGDPVPAGSWLVRGFLTGKNGQVLDTARTQQVLHLRNTGSAQHLSTAKWLHAHHLHYFVSYQPEGHFWAFQGAEGLVLLALAVLVGVATTRAVGGRSRRTRGLAGER